MKRIHLIWLFIGLPTAFIGLFSVRYFNQHAIQNNDTQSLIAMASKEKVERALAPPPCLQEVARNQPITTLPEGVSATSDLGKFLDRSNPHRVSANMEAAIPSVSGEVEIDAVLGVLRDSTENDTVRNEAINLLKRSAYSHINKVLLIQLDNPTEHDRMRAFIVQFLGRSLLEDSNTPTDVDHASENEAIHSRLSTALHDTQSAVRRESLLALIRTRDQDAIEIVHNGFTDPLWSADRDLIIHCAYELGMRDRIEKIRALANDLNLPTRIAALNVLGLWRDQESRPAFAAAAASPVVRLRNAGEVALMELSKSQSAPSADASPSHVVESRTAPP